MRIGASFLGVANLKHSRKHLRVLLKNNNSKNTNSMYMKIAKDVEDLTKYLHA